MLAVASISPLWYLSRGAGFVGLALLGIISVLGVMTASQLKLSDRSARFVTTEVHRNLSLLAVVVLVLHVGAAILDPFAHLKLADAFIPFTAAYRSLWVGLGAVAIDLGIAVLVTSLIRVKMSQKSWKLTHLAAYPIFFLSIVHGLGTGTDSRFWLGKLFYVVVGLMFLLSAWLRILNSQRNIGRFKNYASISAVVAPVLVVAFAFVGPLQITWSKRANAGLSGVFSNSAASISAVKIGSTVPTAKASSIDMPVNFTSSWSGQISESSQNNQGELALRLMGPLDSLKGYKLIVTLIGFPSEGGLSMSSSIVEVVSNSGQAVYNGTVTGLNGGSIQFQATNLSGKVEHFQANVNPGQSSFTGTVTRI